MKPLSNLAVRDIETLIHPYTNLSAFRQTGPVVIEEGKGIYVHDSDGKQYIEGLAGLWCTSLGYGNEELVDTAAEQMRKLPYSHVFAGKSHDKAIELAEMLKEVVPCETSKILFGSSGSDANDMQIKLTWYYNNAKGRPQKKKIISRIKAYHGVTVASGSLTGLPAVHADFDLPINNIMHTSCPHYYRFGKDGETEDEFSTRMATDLEDMIIREGPDTVAGFFAEPIMGAGGVLIPPQGYFQKIQTVLEKYDVRFIGDEVICGFGRTGKWFGSETMGMKPHSISMAKAITSAYLPLSAITIEEDLYQAMLAESEKIGVFGHGYTYTAHPVAAAVAIKTLEIYKRDRIIEHAAAMAPVFEARFNALKDHELIGEVRVKGLVGAAEIVENKTTRASFEQKKLVGMQMMKFAQDRGLLVRSMVDSVALCPPLIITESEIHEMFDRYEAALDDTATWIKKEGLRSAA
jgi:4-aminobutyrate--pyruvate transaminase